MFATKTILSAMGCAAVFGSLAASGVPTRMNPPPEPHWRQLPKAQPVQAGASYRLVDRGPIDLDPELPAPGHPDQLAYDRAHQRMLARTSPAEYEPLHLGEVQVTDYAPLPTAQASGPSAADMRETVDPVQSEDRVAVFQTAEAPDRAAEAAEAAQQAALDVSSALTRRSASLR